MTAIMLVGIFAYHFLPLSQMPGLNQMSSTRSAGASVITLQFSVSLILLRQ